MIKLKRWFYKPVRTLLSYHYLFYIGQFGNRNLWRIHHLDLPSCSIHNNIDHLICNRFPAFPNCECERTYPIYIFRSIHLPWCSQQNSCHSCLWESILLRSCRDDNLEFMDIDRLRIYQIVLSPNLLGKWSNTVITNKGSWWAYIRKHFIRRA